MNAEPRTSSTERLDARLAGAAARVPAFAWIVALSVATWFVFPYFFPSYDYAYALSAGQDIWAGRTPAYALGDVITPLPHPLTLALAVLVTPLGQGAAVTVWIVISLLSFSLLVYSVFDVGRTLFGWPAGAIAAALVYTGTWIFQYAAATYGDVQFAALVFAAAALEARRPKRGASVLALLAVGGWLRPEGWVLAVAYWIYLFPGSSWRSRAALAALVAAGPLAWLAQDLALTGDPLFSRHHAAEFAGRHESVTMTPANAVPTLRHYVSALIGMSVFVAALPGIVLAAVRFRRGAVLLGVLLCITAATTVAASMTGTVAYARFFIIPVSILALFAGATIGGWIGVPPGKVKTAWMAVAAIVAIGMVVLAPARIREWRDEQNLRKQYVVPILMLRDYVSDPVVASALRACPPIYTESFTYRPYLRYWLDVPPRWVSFQNVPDRLVDGVLVASPQFAKRRHALESTDREARRIGAAARSAAREAPGGNARWTGFLSSKCSTGDLGYLSDGPGRRHSSP